MTTLFLVFLAAESIDFYIDPVVFRSEVLIEDTIAHTSKKEDIFYLEYNCAIPYHELSYEMRDSAITTKATIIFELHNLNKNDSLIDTLWRQFTIPSFREAARQQISFVVQFGLHLLEGSYRYNITVRSEDKTGTKQDIIDIKKSDYPISDILLAAYIETDTTGDHLRKGNFKVVPHPSHEFNEQYTDIFIYYEIYDIQPDSNKLSLLYSILDNTQDTLRKFTQQMDKLYTSQAINVAFNIQGLDPGQYDLNVSLRDPASHDTINRKINFSITKPSAQEITYEGLPYYDKIDIFLSPKESKAYKNLPPEGKKAFLQKFWSTRNYQEIAGRFEYADKNFGEGKTSGYITDRGRIYIKYGRPDDWGKSLLEMEFSKPYEHWQYFNGYEFVFVDIRGTNEYTLVWTNVVGEPCQPTLYKYLPAEIREQID